MNPFINKYAPAMERRTFFKRREEQLMVFVGFIRIEINIAKGVS